MSDTQSAPHHQFAKKVLSWFDHHGRKDLPWQQNKNAYRVWVSEIMLQQTQVKTVIPFYLRFLQAFPNVVALADAPQDEVLHLWTGLGYYARARNLHRAAQIIRDTHHGHFPQDIQAVVALPGIGRSTAGAILSIAHEQTHSILDGNVKRVLTRYFALPGWPGMKAVEQQLWQYADMLTPVNRSAHYTQAMMDLGATLCTRSRPRCDDCPLQNHCLAYAQGTQNEFPNKKPKKKIPEKATIMLLPMWNKQVFVYKRPASGIWGGLYGLLELNEEQNLAEFAQTRGFGEYQISRLEAFRHTFSHFHLDIQPLILHLAAPPQNQIKESGDLWYDLTQPANVGLAAPTKKLFDKLANEL